MTRRHMLWIVVIAFVVTLGLLALAVRGRRVDDRTYCRACSFDLSGLSDPAICPECGRDLHRRRATKIGRARPIRWAVIVAAVLLLIESGGIGVAVWGRATSFNWNTVKPEWLLALESRGDPTGQQAMDALSELLSRLKRGTLSHAGTNSLIEDGLTRQADPKLAWSRQWSELIETAWDSGLLAPSQLARYARAYPTLSLTGRPRVPQGAYWQPYLHIGPARLGPDARFQMLIRLDSVEFRDEPLKGFSFGGNASGGLNEVNGSSLGWPGRISNPPGRGAVRMKFHCSVQEGDGTNNNGAPLASWDEVLTTPLEIVPNSASTVELFHDESLRTAFELALHSKGLKVTPVSTGPHPPFMADGLIEVGNLPQPLACHVFWRYEDPAAPGTFHEMRCSSDVVLRPRTTLGYRLPLWPTFTATRVDVILRPNIGAAEMTEDITRLWDGEIVFPDQTIERTPSQPR